jgi:hypothetical protein
LGIHADDTAELWLSTNDSPINKKQIATVGNYINSYQFKYPEQKSIPVWLEEGEQYFVEVLYKQNNSGAHCQLSWLPPGTSTWTPLPEDRVSSWADAAGAFDRNGFSSDWLVENDLTAGTLRPAAFFSADSFLNFWQSFRLGISPALTAAQVSSLNGAAAPQGWIREIWLNASGSSIAANQNKFLTAPDRREVVRDGNDFSSQTGDNYLTRTRGYLVVPEDGDYRFALNSDDNAELWLSTDDSIGRARRLVNTDYTAPNVWSGAAQQSVVVTLQAGARYFVEIRHREGGYDDFLRVAWQTPGSTVWEFIPNSAMRVHAPQAGDALGFGYPQSWFTEAGLTSLTLEQRAPWADPFDVGFTNLELHTFGLPPVTRDAAGNPVSSLAGLVEIPGRLLREVWLNLAGPHVSQLLFLTNDFRKLPNSISLLEGAAAPVNFADNYGQRLRGHITIPQNGAYRFYTAGDDSVELFISESGTKWNRERAAWTRTYTSVAQWDKQPSQRSREFLLTAGQKIFVEVLHKENGSGDHAQLGWLRPGANAVEIVPAQVLSSYAYDANDADDDDLPDDWETARGLSAADNGSVNAANGKHAVLNNQGLTNHQCALLNLDPLAPVIDGVLGVVEVPGALQREVWTNLPGTALSVLTNAAKFAAAADQKTFVQPGGFADIGSNYGERWRGWIIVVETGDYRLGVTADDSAQLWLSSDASPANKRQIATVPAYTNVGQFKYRDQQGLSVRLEAGQRYYVEILYKENNSTAHCGLYWLTPWETSWYPIPNTHLSSWVDDPALDRNGFPLAWLSTNNLTPGSLLPDAFFQSTSFLPNWTASRFGLDPRVTGAEDLPAAPAPAPQGWIRDIWFNATGAGIAANQNKFFTAPDRREAVLGGADFSSQIGDSYLTRTRGYLVPSTSGSHRLDINSDDESEVWLSTDANTVNASRVISTGLYTTWGVWTDIAQQSAPFLLQAGQSYFVEIRHREGGYDDTLLLAWQPPGADALDFIPASAMRPYFPAADDPFGFGYPASWLASTGLSALSIEQQAPWADPNNDGLTNLEKYHLGLNPLSADTDGDGIGDWEEVRLAGTNAAVADFDGTSETLLTINGADFLPPAGNTGILPASPIPGITANWQIANTSAYAADIRGALAYTIPLTTAGTHRLLITGGQYLPTSAEKILTLDVYIDNRYIGRATLDVNAAAANAATAALWLPHLSAGNHTLRLVWLNGVVGSSLRLDNLTIEARGGTWLTTRQNTFSHIDPAPISSYTSPYCLEGRAPDASLLQITTDYTPATTATDIYSVYINGKFFSGISLETPPPAPILPAFPALRGAFYSDIPLSPTAATTTLSATDTATGAAHAKTLTWQPYDIALHAVSTSPTESTQSTASTESTSATYHLRAGDSLLLQSTADITITAPDSTQTTLSADTFTTHSTGVLVIPYVFALPGVYQISTTTTSATPPAPGDPPSDPPAPATHTVTIHATAADLSPAPTAIQSQIRAWTPALLPADSELFHDDGLRLVETAPINAKRTLNLQSTSTLPARILARLGETGPILATTEVNTLHTATQAVTNWAVVETFPDGTVMWKATLSFGGTISENFRAKLTMYKSGSVFDDGSNIRWVAAVDFDVNGTYTYYMLLPANVTGSACHSALYYDGDELISDQL